LVIPFVVTTVETIFWFFAPPASTAIIVNPILLPLSILFSVARQ